jgi:hypothetical protein
MIKSLKKQFKMSKVFVDKELIENIKNDSKLFWSFVKEQNDNSLIYLLNKLGRLDKDFNNEPLMFLLSNSNENIRVLAMKNLAKLEDVSLLSFFVFTARRDYGLYT